MSSSAHLNNTYMPPAIKVVADSLVPQQVDTSIGLRKSADCYQQKFIKFPYIGIFHSYAEFIHAALLESDQSVLTFVPQPYLLRVGQQRYIPDCYYMKDGVRYVVEIKPGAKFKDELRIPLTEFMKFNGLQFKVISNEEILDKEILGLNWLHLVRTLISAELEDTASAELALYQQILETGDQVIGDVISMQNRISSRAAEIALFRLVYRDKLKLDFQSKRINLDTKIICT